MDNLATAIDGPRVHPDALLIRGIDQRDLIERLSYSAALHHLLTGEFPARHQEEALEEFLCRSLHDAAAMQGALEVAHCVGSTGASPYRAICAALASGAAAPPRPPRAGEDPHFEPEALRGLAWVARIPAFLATAVAARRGRTLADAAGRLDESSLATGYLARVAVLCRGGAPPDAREQALLAAVLIAFQAGWGFLTPTVMLPRIAAGTGVDIEVCLAAGFTAAGPAHTGACDQVMSMFEQMRPRPEEGPESQIDAELERRRGAGERIPGFGHTLFEADPRVDALVGRAETLGVDGPVLRVFRVLRARMLEDTGIHPNVDLVGGALLATLGFTADFGTGLFMASRAGAMLAHVLEKRGDPYFGIRRPAARDYFSGGEIVNDMQVAVDWGRRADGGSQRGRAS